MAIHAIILQNENSEVAERIAEHYRFNYPVNEKCFLVHTDDISEKVADTVGFGGENKIENAVGAVFKLNGTYSGFASSGLWEWLEMEKPQ
ncbi:hypothetical protein [Candidatus Spongiihabitans sp.]|uniref:hypothetical protein n=1 Tax=Candidatus Spongiihabitans sp. TaxID=3101308 RepID=UPI003C704FA4